MRRPPLAAVLVLCASGAAAAADPPGLVARYRGEGNAEDTLGNHGTAVGNVAYAAGPEGRGFLLDGSGHVEVENVLPFVEHLGAFTVASGGAFVRKGDVFRHASKDGAASLKVTVDFAKGVATVVAKGVELGALDEAAVELVFGDAGLVPAGASGPATAVLRLGAAGAKRRY